MQTIDIFVRVLQTPPTQTGSAVVLYRFGNKIKELYFSTLENTQNRSIILASAIAIQGLKYRCNISLYTQNNFGFAYMENHKKKWVNRDIGNLLAESISKGGHMVKFNDCSLTEESKDYQQALASRLKASNE